MQNIHNLKPDLNEVISSYGAKMASKFDSTQLSLLKQFVELCKTKPELLYSPQLKFFKDWVERYRNLYALYYCNILSDNRHVQLYNA